MSVDLVTVELIERALRGLRDEMDAVVLRSAMSPIIREQHDEFPLVTNADGLMLVGQFGSYVPLLLETYGETIDEGDVILQSDPYLCDGAIQHTPRLARARADRLPGAAPRLHLDVRTHARRRRNRAGQHGGDSEVNLG